MSKKPQKDYTNERFVGLRIVIKIMLTLMSVFFVFAFLFKGCLSLIK